jgi:heptose I phosphotransferase
MTSDRRTHGTLWQRLFKGIVQLKVQPDRPAFHSMQEVTPIMGLSVTDRFHAKQGRSTARHVLRTPSGDVAVYLKRHYVLPRWHGLMATLFPDAGWSPGLHEWQHLEWAYNEGLPVPRAIAAAQYIGPWGKLRSFLAVEELTGMLPLHEAIPLAASQLPPTAFARWKRTLVKELARLARALHDRHYFHKDLYLCHFFMRTEDTAIVPSDWKSRVSMIDFHRLKHHSLTWPMWQSKDLAQLLYSSDIEGISARDRLRFWREYWGGAYYGFRATILRRLILIKWRLYVRHNRKMARRVAEARISASA